MAGIESRVPLFLGAGAAAAVAVGATVSFLNKKNDSKETAADVLSAYPSLQRDVSAATSVRELAGLYERVDSALFQTLLQSLEELLSLQGAPETTRVGQRNVARALRARRRANTALDDLRRGARRRFPGQAAEAAEDDKMVGKAITDALHNIQLSSTLPKDQ